MEQEGNKASISSHKLKNPECESVRDFFVFTIHLLLFIERYRLFRILEARREYSLGFHAMPSQSRIRIRIFVI